MTMTKVTLIGIIITLFGIIITFLISVASLVIGILNSRKTIFINSITASRIKYLQDLRNTISEFSGLIYRYNNFNKFTKNDINSLLREIDKLAVLIKLYLNPEDTFFDTKIGAFIDDIQDSIENNPRAKINELITVTQYLLKLEWERAKMESRNGIITKVEKDKLYYKYVGLHEKHIKK